MANDPFIGVGELADRIPDGCLLAVPKEPGVAMEATRALIRRGVRDLHLLSLPVSSLQADLLIGAGCVRIMETSGVSMGEFGFAPRFRDAVQNGKIEIRDATCPAIYAALQASEKGIPFIPLRGLIGSDLRRYRPEWRIIDNPFAVDEDPIVLLPAITPDVALFHAPLGDRHGNVWIGNRRECVTLAHASRGALVTVEEIYDGNLMEDERLVAGTIPPVYVDAVAHAPRGAWPLGLTGRYPSDAEHLRAYVQQAKTDEGFAKYMAQFVLPSRAAA